MWPNPGAGWLCWRDCVRSEPPGALWPCRDVRRHGGTGGPGGLSCRAPIAPCSHSAARAGSAVAPMLRLAPSALVGEWTVVQQLEVQAGGQKRSLDIALEVDAQSVRMAFMQWGHTVARLDW